MSHLSLNPARPSDVVLEFDGPTAAVAPAAARAAQAARAWAATPAAARGAALSVVADALEQRAGELAALVTREVGKPIVEARGEIARAVAIYRYYATAVLAPDGETYPGASPSAILAARRYPVGVCAVIAPWNFPVATPSWKIAPALAYGNAVLFKPAVEATATARLLSEIVAAQLPDGLLELLEGGADVGAALVAEERVDAVTFTGSLAGGRAVAQQAAARGIPAQCEMSGHNPSIVLPSADLAAAAQKIAYAAMGYAGQKCTATSRIIVHDDVYDELRDRLVAAVEALTVVDPSDERCLVGPLIDAAARSSASAAVEASGGSVLTGGGALDDDGFYLAPALVELPQQSGPLGRDEVFAPVAGLLRARSAEHAIELANDSPFGLVASVFTRELGSALEALPALRYGLVRVNAPTSGLDYHVPFGGSKASGLGPKEQGLAARDFYTETRTLLVEA
ncbi:aldehyde dehydrogenase family protein [Conexibacter sp. CPCC 206217]|uniref:aldehyde dehydrogenase family protein n=1 Tax=Conexibacter sp. CPCC 206217 TaxID=3064574 RepID=UPI00271FF6AC|nr:aldehyde dehydrogenase family protein [Conexibacter sp. CPCC 206217]MDO8208915.1 aldehyde dehydrogenase family protein [Conexibacter sp. CPCC 206217]